VSAPQPTDIKLRTASRLLEVHFDDGSNFELPFEYLRVFSPSAEVRGHGAAKACCSSVSKMWESTAWNPWEITPCGCSSTMATIPACILGASSTS
jgi:hypothetical protein